MLWETSGWPDGLFFNKFDSNSLIILYDYYDYGYYFHNTAAAAAATSG